MARAKRARTGFNLVDHDDEDDEEFIDDVKLELESTKPRKTAASTAVQPAPARNHNRVENLRERIQLFYGDKDEELVRAIELRAKWGNILFSVSPNDLAMTEPSLVDQPNQDFLSALQPGDARSGGHSIRVDGVQLAPHEVRKCEDTAAILNVGNSVIAMDWSWHGLLAVSVRVTDEDPMSASTILEENNAGGMLIFIYAVNGTQITLRGSIKCAQGLAATSVKWRPFGSELAIVLANGSGVAVVTIPASFEGDHTLLLQTDQFARVVASPVTQVCWRTPDNLVVGYKDGHIAEFSIVDEDSSPSYVARPHSTIITALASAWPDYPDTLFTSSVDGFSTVYETVADLRVCRRAPRLKFYAPCGCYSPAAESFISLEDVDTTKLVPWRRPELVQAQTTLTRHGTGVSAVAASSAHPLLISGGQDGELHIANPLRRTMVTRRNRDVHTDCAVWRLECSHRAGEYRFVDLLVPSSLPKRKLPSHLPVYPSVVTISDLAWQPNGVWCAAATVSGLIRFDNMTC